MSEKQWKQSSRLKDLLSKSNIFFSRAKTQVRFKSENTYFVSEICCWDLNSNLSFVCMFCDFMLWFYVVCVLWLITVCSCVGSILVLKALPKSLFYSCRSQSRVWCLSGSWLVIFMDQINHLNCRSNKHKRGWNYNTDGFIFPSVALSLSNTSTCMRLQKTPPHSSCVTPSSSPLHI